jgi:uncharacterized cupredoxin-like copper-binding protein
MKYRLILGCFLVTFILALTACGSSTASSTTSPAQSTPSGAQNVQVTITDTAMMSSSLSTFAPGMPYHFVVTNSGHVPYVFMMATMGMSMEHMSIEQMHHAALYMFDQVAPGETRAFDYTFAQSAVGGRFEFTCYPLGHVEMRTQFPFIVNAHQ